MKELKIEIITDDDIHECEICGSSFAEGGKVYVDGVLVIDKPATAHCYGSSDNSPSDLMVLALDKLGQSIYVDGEKYHIQNYDEEYHKLP